VSRRRRRTWSSSSSPKASARRLATPSAGNIRPSVESCRPSPARRRWRSGRSDRSSARIDRPHGSIVCTDHGAVLALDPNERGPRVPDCAHAGDSRGTACASLHSGAPASPLATVRAGAAAHRVLLRNEVPSHVRVTPVTVLE